MRELIYIFIFMVPLKQFDIFLYLSIEKGYFRSAWPWESTFQWYGGITFSVLWNGNVDIFLIKDTTICVHVHVFKKYT